MRRPRVVYWNNIPAPYMVDRFTAVTRRGNLDLEVWFNDEREPGRSWAVEPDQWQFRSRYLPTIGLADRRLPLPLGLVGPEPPDVLVSLYDSPAFVLGWELAWRRGIRTAFWVEVTRDAWSWIRRRWWKDALKRRMFARVTALLTVGPDGHAFARRYGAPPDRILYVPHVVDVERIVATRAAALPERAALRQGLGLRGVVFAYVGRLWEPKGLDELLDAFAVLHRQGSQDVSLLLVGDGPQEASLRRRCAAEGLDSVVFAGFQPAPALPRYYAAADVFVFPTHGDTYGLVVDEAMACALPVLSTDAAGEIGERVDDGVTGFVVPARNSAALYDRMDRLARDAALRSRMGTAGAARIAGATPERWARDFERAIEHLLAVPPSARQRPRNGAGLMHRSGGARGAADAAAWSPAPEDAG